MRSSGRADLHLHTTCSDGKLTPEELARSAGASGLAVIAVTDHDSIEGIAPAAAAAKPLGVRVLPGVELSVTVGLDEVHLLGYCFDPEFPKLTAYLARFREQRLERAAGMVEALNRIGVRLDLEDVLARADGGAVGRPHVAQALVDGGFAASVQEAFEKYVGDGGPAYVARARFDAEDALALLHEAGGVGVLAHPGQWTPDSVIQYLIGAGLDGIEVVHPSHQPWLEHYYRDLAERHGLLETGGSDFHGWRASEAGGLGRHTVAMQTVERMVERGRR